MNTKTFVTTAVGLIGLSGFAYADGSPILQGNYSQNVLDSYEADVRIMSQVQTTNASPVFGYSARNITSPAVAGPDALSPVGNYAPNFRMEDIRGN